MYAAAFGATFGAVAVGTGLSVPQVLVLQSVMFTGASQFAFVGVLANGGSPFAAVPAALLLGTRNAFYGVPVSGIVRPRGIQRFWTAHFVIDETTGMAVAQPTPRARRYAFWVTGFTLFVLWVLGGLAGALAGRSIDLTAFGLDAAAPAVFLALLAPQLRLPAAPAVAILAAIVAVVLIPFAPAGVPVIAAAGVALAGGLIGPASRGRRDSAATPATEPSLRRGPGVDGEPT